MLNSHGYVCLVCRQRESFYDMIIYGVFIHLRSLSSTVMLLSFLVMISNDDTVAGIKISGHFNEYFKLVVYKHYPLEPSNIGHTGHLNH